jgi:LCP family protein required for cell wall assembly
VLGGLGVVLLSGAATAVVALNEVSKVVEALGQNGAVKLAPKVLAPSSRGAPQTLLLVGDDRRPPPKSNPNGFVVPHSNEMLLVRIDPGKPTISMLSIPRELQVKIEPPGSLPLVNRINVAYTIGGIQLMTETIKRVLGIAVNHVFVVTFPKFKRAVNEMGCVYMTVDRRYFHFNEPGGEQYFEINLQPGYQRVCGTQALEFVANRHEDTSLTRDARDQRFLLEVKAQYGATLFENREKFERILGRAVETDLHGSGQVLDLLELLVQAQGKPVRQVPFQVNLLPSYDTATPQQIHESVQSFLAGTSAINRQRLRQPAHASRPHTHARPSSGPSLTPTPGATLAHARSAAASLPFPLEYPRGRDTFAAAVPDSMRVYDIRDPRGRLQPTYAIVVNRGPLGQFYDIQGTSWADPPLLSNPSETIHVGARTYELFYAGEHVKTIAWRDGEGTYWIQNTLTNSVSPQTMLAMAEQTVPVVSGGATAPALSAGIHPLALPPHAAASNGLASQLGDVLGLVSLAGLAPLALWVLSRQRQLRTLREQVAHAMTLEARQRPLLATAAEVTSVSAHSGPSVYRAPRRVRRGVLAGGLALLLAAVAAAGVRLSTGSSSPRAPVPGAPVAVAVFNATSVPGVAHSVAATLQAGHVRLGKVGDIKNVGLGHGAYVLYPPGTETQARAVAQLIGGLSPTVTAIQPQVENAANVRQEIVIVLD